LALDELNRVQALEREHQAREAETAISERTGLAAMGIAAVVGAALYLGVFTLPLNIFKLQTYFHLDLERWQIGSGHVQWLLYATLLAEGALYWLAWQAAGMARGRAAWAVAIGGAIVLAVPLFFIYPVGSTDIFDYIMHGRMIALYHADPFKLVAAQFPGDIFSTYSGWATATSAYGPLWESLAGFVARFGGNSVASNVLVFKLLEGLFLAGSGALIALVLRRAAPERALAGFVLFTWNPIVLYETVGNGHNDMVMVFCMLAAAAALYFRRYTLAILLLVAGTLFKYIPVLMLPAAGLIALRDLPDWRGRVRFVVVAGLLAAALVVASYAPYWHGLQTLAINRREQLFTTSLTTMILWLIQPAMPLDKAMGLISRLAFVATMLFACWEGLRAWRDRSWLSFTRSAYHISVFYILAAVTWLWPWYSLWPLALAALLPAGWETALAEILAFDLSLRPFVYSWLIIHRPAGATAGWVELRLSPATLGAAWLTAAGLFIAALVSRFRRATGAVRTA
jgi:hypothetical protein